MTTSNTMPCAEQLQETMTKLEKALLSPLVSGELKLWALTVQQAAATFNTDWARHLHTVLHVQYADIVREDPELATAVNKMMQADRELLEAFAKFHENLHELVQRAERVDNHESKLEEHRKNVEKAGIELIVSIKKQMTSADTWLSEALYRDRGVGD